MLVRQAEVAATAGCGTNQRREGVVEESDGQQTSNRPVKAENGSQTDPPTDTPRDTITLKAALEQTRQETLQQTRQS